MKKIIYILILSISVIFASSCHKGVIAISDLQIHPLSSFSKDLEDEIDETQKEYDNEKEDFYYKENLKKRLGYLKKRLKYFKDYEKKYLQAYPELRRMLLDKFNNNKNTIIQFMGDSSGIKLQDIGHQADFMLFVRYIITKMPPDNRKWDKIRGFLLLELADVETGVIVWVSDPYANIEILGKYSDSAKNMFSIAWPHILNKITRANKLEKIISQYLDHKGAKLKYTHSDDKKIANGKSKGKITIQKITSDVLWHNPKPRNIATFTLQAMQGKFADNKQEVTSIPRDYTSHKEKQFEYTTYNCRKEGIKDKYYETFTLTRSCFLGKEDNKILKVYKEKFNCPDFYYTLTLDITNYAQATPKNKYRGINEPLKSYELEHLIYYVYVDEDEGVIHQYLDTKKSYVKTHSEKYKLNSLACQFKKVVDEDTNYLKYGYYMKFLKSEDNGWGLDDDSKIYINLPHLKNKPFVLWKRLKNSGYYSKNLTYSYEEPGLKMLQSAIDQGYSESTPLVGSKASKLLQAMVVAYAPSEQAKCNGKIVFESWFPGPLGSVNIAKPKIKAKISIRPSNENEINIMKKYLKRYRY